MALFQSADVATKVINVWNGSVQRLDAYSVPDGNGLFSANCSYIRGKVQTRYGHNAVFSDSSHGSISSMYNWFYTQTGSPTRQVSFVMYYAPSYGILGYAQFPTPGFTGILFPTTGAAGAIMLGTGNRLYAAFYDTTGKLSTYSGQVYGDGVGLDNLFAAPITNSIAASETASGVVTAGLHRIGYVFTTRNGYTGKLCPVNGSSVFSPISFTSAGSKNLQLTISGSLPSYLGSPATFQIVMTVVGQPDTYYEVPGAFASCANPTVITINIDDYDLAATGTDFTNYQLLLASSVGGTPPFYPSDIFTYSSRMGYVTIDGAGFPVTYFSEPNAFQYITADQHGIYLEGNQQTVVGFSLRGVCYLATQTAVYSCEDSGDVPVNWTPPQKVDGSIGVQSPTCITVNPSLGYAAIAADRGFYIFQGGIFPALPLSYYQQPDWERIDWQNPTQIKVVDDQLNKRFIVLAPLTVTIAAVVAYATNQWLITTTSQDPTLYPAYVPAVIDGISGIISGSGLANNAPANQFIWLQATEPSVGMVVYPSFATHQMTWDYTEGDTPEIVKYSLNSMANYAPAAMSTVQNFPNALQEVWYAPTGTNASLGGDFIRQCDGTEQSNYYSDADSQGTLWPILWLYETNLIPGIDDQSMTLHYFSGMHFRAFGNGYLTFKAFGLDGVRSVTPAASPLTLSATPGQEYRSLWNLMNEQESILFSISPTGPANSYAVLSLVRAYYVEAWAQR